MKKIDKNYLKWCALLLKTLPKLRKYSTDNMIVSCINSSCNKEYSEWVNTWQFCLNDNTLKTFNQLDLIVRNLLPYLSDETILQLCSLGGTQ